MPFRRPRPGLGLSGSKRASFERGGNVRAWLYRIATNVCLDDLRRRKRTPRIQSFADTPWLQPYPDHLLDAASPPDLSPDEVVVTRDTIELAFVAALQLLPAQQRAALVMRDVIGWSAAEVADILGRSVPAVNRALQRARVTVQRHRADSGQERKVSLDTAERASLNR